MGIDFATSFTEVINNLDQNLISELGSGVSIEYAKKYIPAKEDQK